MHIKDILNDANTFASTMVIQLIDRYTNELFTWTPQTIRMETEEDFDFRWNDINFDRLMAGIILVTTDNFYKSLPDFIDLCNVLNGSGLNPTVFDPADTLECAWGITEALLLGPPEEDDPKPFNDEICSYIGAALDVEGIIVPPDILKIALRNKDHVALAGSNYSDDPDLYSAIWKNEKEKTDEINTIVKERISLLISQLEQLQLVNGSTDNIVERIRGNMKG